MAKYILQLETNYSTLIYLWTRDGKFPVSERTEEYINQHLEALLNNEHIFSDKERESMALRIVKIHLKREQL